MPAKRIRPFVDIVSIVGEEVWEYLRVNPNARLLTDHACAVDAESVTDAARVLPIADLTAPSELGSIVILGTITFEYTAGTKKVCVASRCFNDACFQICARPFAVVVALVACHVCKLGNGPRRCNSTARR